MTNGSLNILSGDFKNGAGHTFSNGRLTLIKPGDDDLKEEISGKTVSSVTVKKTEGATRGLVPFECTLEDGRSFVAETDIETYKALTKQAQENKNNNEPATQPATTTKAEKKVDEVLPTGSFSQLSIGFKVLGILLLSGFTLMTLSKCGPSPSDKKRSAAVSLCKSAIQSIVIDPKNTSIPWLDIHALDVGDGYSVSWTRENPIRTRNRLGLDVPTTAKCRTNADATVITHLEFDGETIIR